MRACTYGHGVDARMSHDAEERGSPHVCRQRDPITNLGRKLIKFLGTVAAEGRARTSGFARLAWVREPLTPRMTEL